MRNVREFKNFLKEEAGVIHHADFIALRPECAAFWKKLNALWNPNKVPPTPGNDVDALTELTDEQWEELTSELRELLART